MLRSKGVGRLVSEDSEYSCGFLLKFSNSGTGYLFLQVSVYAFLGSSPESQD